MANIGYARVSTEEQNLDMQRYALEVAGCETIFEDKGVSAAAERRPGFEAALASLNTGDILIVWKFDRAFRSVRQSMDTLEQLEKRGGGFRSLTDPIDTSTPTGYAMFQIRSVFAELERKLIVERTKEGLRAARRRGKVLGRPPSLSNASVAWARDVLGSNAGPTICAVAKSLNVSARTLRRALDK